MADSIIELSFISSTVAWLHNQGGGVLPFHYQVKDEFDDIDRISYVTGRPLNLFTFHGHIANGSAGTAFVLIGLLGILLLTLRKFKPSVFKSVLGTILYYIWLVLSVLSVALNFAALVYVFRLKIWSLYSGDLVCLFTRTESSAGDKR